jgi:ubiquinone/menaquinone biosynthesis C-methylase UbiE
VLFLAAVKKNPGKLGLPAYAAMMADYHRAFAPELKAIIQSLPIRPGERILDFACGDGSYARWLARRVGPAGKVLAVDISPAFLDVARRSALRSATGRRIQFLQADIHRLPVAANGLDLAWCAQSLYSLPDPIDALRRMLKAVRPGGSVAVFENDEFHHVLLPWPVEIELALKKAELISFVATSDRPRKYYVGRDLCRLFRTAGLKRCQAQGVVFTRQAPLDHAARSFFTAYLENLRLRVGPHLEPSLRELFDRLSNPRSKLFLLSSPDLTVMCVNQVVIGIKSSPQRMRKT